MVIFLPALEEVRAASSGGVRNCESASAACGKNKREHCVIFMREVSLQSAAGRDKSQWNRNTITEYKKVVLIFVYM